MKKLLQLVEDNKASMSDDVYTQLVAGLNDTEKELKKANEFLKLSSEVEPMKVCWTYIDGEGRGYFWVDGEWKLTFTEKAIDGKGFLRTVLDKRNGKVTTTALTDNDFKTHCDDGPAVTEYHRDLISCSDKGLFIDYGGRNSIKIERWYNHGERIKTKIYYFLDDQITKIRWMDNNYEFYNEDDPVMTNL